MQIHLYFLPKKLSRDGGYDYAICQRLNIFALRNSSDNVLPCNDALLVGYIFTAAIPDPSQKYRTSTIPAEFNFWILCAGELTNCHENQQITFSNETMSSLT